MNGNPSQTQSFSQACTSAASLAPSCPLLSSPSHGSVWQAASSSAPPRGIPPDPHLHGSHTVTGVCLGEVLEGRIGDAVGEEEVVGGVAGRGEEALEEGDVVARGA